MADPLTELRSGLASTYTVERELGRGGMATVYLALDVRHDRPVALKVLHPDLANALGAERFQREIRLAARLQHPHILTVHDSGETGGQLWFTMPFVEGESLRQRLDREKQLPVADAVRIAREAAQALEYAHQHGVVHRDIKPENLLLTEDGNTLVADFGIARTLSASAARLTETGLAIGTPAYMSPEQASGEHDVTARTDIYSLGAVLYEMLTGEPPFTGATPQAVIAKRFTGEVPSVRRIRPNVPESLDGAIGRALALIPADRFASAAELARALVPAETSGTTQAATVPPVAARPARRKAPVAFVTLIVGFAIGLGVLFAWNKPGTGGGGDGARRLAVLPFDNIGATEDDYFADGLTDAIRGKLTAVAGLRVTASGSSNEYQDSKKTLAEIAGELGVDYLLVGKVRWVKLPDGTSRVRVSPELIEVATGTATWQEPFDAALTDVFVVQSDIAGRVAAKLDVALTDSAKTNLEAKPTGNLAAYDAYLRARALSGSDPPTLRRAIAAAEQAVALDPSFAQAWARLGVLYGVLHANGVPSTELSRKSRAALDRAIALAPNLGDGYLGLATYFRVVDRQPDSARIATEKGMRLNPSDPRALGALAADRRSLGDWDSALALQRRAVELDPRAPSRASNLATILVRMRRISDARVAADRAMELAPDDLGNLQTRVMVDLAAGDLSAARSILRRTPADPVAVAAYMSTYEDLYWVLAEAEQDVILRLTPAAFDDDRASWALVLTQIHASRLDTIQTRAYADTARIEFANQLRAAPNDAQLHALHGIALAYGGRKAEAVAEGERGLQLMPPTLDGVIGPYLLHQMARIHLLNGDQERALDRIEALFKLNYYLTPGWLRIDPNFAPLRGNPRFERLAKGA